MKNQKIINVLIIVFGGLLFLSSTMVSGSENADVLLINSNAAVEKYREAQDEFKKALSNSVQAINLEDDDVDRKLSAVRNPGLVYCIGTKAYYFAARHFAEKDIVFSSVINWLRLSLTPKTYGVSNELHPRMPLVMFRSVFPNIRNIGILYSQRYMAEWFESTRSQAQELGIHIIGKSVSHRQQILPNLKQLLSETDAIWLISDPLVMPEKEYLYQILRQCDAAKKPVFSYHNAFVNLGVVMVVAVDNPTIGRQAAGIAADVISGNRPDDKVQFPAGTEITLNLKKVKEYALEYNMDALKMVNRIIK